MNREKKLYAVFLLDRSTSMDVIRGEAVAGFNEQLATVKKFAKEQPTRVSLVTFGSQADEPKMWNRPAHKIEPLNIEDYRPDGMTAMYDAVGITIDRLTRLEDAYDPDTSFLVTIVSDGQENNSKKYTANDIASKVSELQATKRWTFTYLGANQDLAKVSKDLHIPLGNMMAFTADSYGTTLASHTTSKGLEQYFSCVTNGSGAVDNFYSNVSSTDQAKIDPSQLPYGLTKSLNSSDANQNQVLSQAG